ncbi:MAG: pseudouridylate synthase [Salibacteraceae bacterium]
MNKLLIFNFKTDISGIEIPARLNNPFSSFVPEIAKIAASEFQDFINSESLNWNYDFKKQKGKMFGVLVVQTQDNSLGYLGTISGKLSHNETCSKFIPSIFDDSVDDFFINKGMTALTAISHEIKDATEEHKIQTLKEKRKQKSLAIQQQLFENYQFVSVSGKKENILDIFENSAHGNPPSGAGECAGPKLLQYAIRHRLKPIAIAEFWWGIPKKSQEREHQGFYPACKNKCRPILEYMLENTELFNERIL